MKTIAFLVTGTHPVMMHNPASMARGSSGATVKKIPTPEDEAKAARYMDEDGNFYLPAQAFKGCLVSAVKGKRVGKTIATSLFKGTIFCPEERCTLIDPKTKRPIKADTYKIDIRRAVIKGMGVLRARPTVFPWACKLALDVNEQHFGDAAAMILEALNDGGATVGVGDYRPEKGGPFGRFTAVFLSRS